MWTQDILIAIELLKKQCGNEDFCIERIDHHFIYFTDDTRIAFRDIEGFMSATGRE